MKRFLFLVAATVAFLVAVASPAMGGHELINAIDPPDYALVAWWRWVYYHLFGGNTLLMFLFGWEIFMLGFPVAAVISIFQLVF
jgi:hypothetical protein